MENKITLKENIESLKCKLDSMNVLTDLCASRYYSFKRNQAYRKLLRKTHKKYKRLLIVVDKQMEEQIKDNITWFKL